MYSAKFPPKTHRVFFLQITGSPAIFHGTWQVSKKSQAIRCWTILSRDNQGKAAFAAGQLSTESLNWDLFCWWLQHVTCISVVKSRSLGAELRFLTLSSMVQISAGGRSSNHQRNNQKWSQCFKQPNQFLIISYHHHRLMMVQKFLGRMPI